MKEETKKIYVLHAKSSVPKRSMGLLVTILLKEDPKLSELMFNGITQRGTEFYARNFIYNKDNSTLEFHCMHETHSSFLDVWGSKTPNCLIATTYQDFCWLKADGTTNISAMEINTPILEKYGKFKVVKGDLTHVIPSKISDDFLEFIEDLNNEHLLGLMEDAMLYGPLVTI